MKRCVIIFLLLIFTVACGNTDELHLTTNSNDWTVENEDDFSISFPKDWVYRPNPNVRFAFFIYSPKTSEKDIFVENVNLLKEDLGESGIDLDTYYELTVKSLNKLGIKFIESKKEIANGTSYYEVLYELKNNKPKSYAIQRYYVNETTAYVITFSVEKKAYKSYKLIGKHILNSFRFQ